MASDVKNLILNWSLMVLISASVGWASVQECRDFTAGRIFLNKLTKSDLKHARNQIIALTTELWETERSILPLEQREWDWWIRFDKATGYSHLYRDPTNSLNALIIAHEVGLPMKGVSIEKLAVVSGARGNKYAVSMLREVAITASRRQQPKIFLHVLRENTKAQNFYRAMGFTEIGEGLTRYPSFIFSVSPGLLLQTMFQPARNSTSML